MAWRGEFLLLVGAMPLLMASVVAGETPFAVRVIEFAPAPGQWVNDGNFNDPMAALGRPHAGGFAAPDQSSIVSLGGFGGSITLAFDHTVMDETLNPFGTDATVFSNAFWPGGNPQAHWAELATIEICLDANGNGLPDDNETWYLIPGSHITDPTKQFAVQTWDDDIADETYPPAHASWIPPGYSGVWTTWAFALPSDLFASLVIWNPSDDPEVEGVFGYAEYSPTLSLGDTNGDNVVDDPAAVPEEFYAIPDDPMTVGITPGSGGGDAFDIAWAIDPENGAAANLPGFDFIRLTTAADIVVDVLAEISAEIDAVADVAPDPFGDFDTDGDRDLVDVAGLQNCYGGSNTVDPPCSRIDRQPDGLVDEHDVSAFVPQLTGPQ